MRNALFILPVILLTMLSCGVEAPKPLYRDPIHDGAADPEIIQNRETGDLTSIRQWLTPAGPRFKLLSCSATMAGPSAVTGIERSFFPCSYRHSFLINSNSPNLKEASNMKQSSRNIIWLLVGAAFSCIAIPRGIHEGFTSIQIGACMAFILVSLVIISWNRHFFNPIIEIEGKSIWIHILATTMFTVGLFELINAHECGFWRNCAGGAMLVGGAVLDQFFVKREDDAKNGNETKTV